ncbi:ClpX C4-type zinc finger protein [Novipirellula sp. SH528]|uniref:ClpX C4-type zinc finger protein n=1 Tax=Novipirellula sp. SH528 TaxID=3454466 RepID=UPI003FA10FA5
MLKSLLRILLGTQALNGIRCSFCSVHHLDCSLLVEAPHDVFICAGCVESAVKSDPQMVAPHDVNKTNPYSPLPRATCSFCEKLPPNGIHLASNECDATICRDCLVICARVIAEHEE